MAIGKTDSCTQVDSTHGCRSTNSGLRKQVALNQHGKRISKSKIAGQM